MRPPNRRRAGLPRSSASIGEIARDFRFNFQTADRRSHSHGGSRLESCSNVVPRRKRGRRECRVSGSPAASRAKMESTRVSHHWFAETFRHSLRDGFTVSFVLFLVIGLFCHHPRAECQSILAGLTPASRQQAHTTSPSSACALVLRAVASNRIPHSMFVTIAKRSSDGRGTREEKPLICPSVKAKYFSVKDWTAKANRPDRS